MTPVERRELYGLVQDAQEPMRALVRFMERGPGSALPLRFIGRAEEGLRLAGAELEEQIDAES